MKAMARHRSHSIEFKRQIAQEFIAGETLHALARRHDVSRNLIRVWVKKLETGAFDDDTRAADLLQEHEAKIAALERMVGRQALEIESRFAIRLRALPQPVLPSSDQSKNLMQLKDVLEFKRQIAQEFIAGETLHALARRHEIGVSLGSAPPTLASQIRPLAAVKKQARNCRR
jgi:transposase